MAKKKAKRFVTLEGSVDQLPSGRWRARLPRRLGRAALSRTFLTEQQAWDALQQEIEERDHPTPVPPPDPTVGEMVAAFVAAPHLSASTARTYRSSAARIPESLRSVPLSALTKEMVATWARQAVAGGLKPTSVDQSRRLLAAALNYYASGAGAVASSVAVWGRGTQAASAAKAARSHPILTWQTMRAISVWDPATSVSCTSNARVDASWRLFIETVLWGGLREGEALALTGADIDSRRPVLLVTRAAVASERRVGSPKTASSLRPVAIPVGVWRALQERAAALPPGALLFSGYRMPEEKAALVRQGKLRSRGGPDPIRADGRPLSKNAALRRWELIRGDVDAPERATIHSLRATAASVMLDAGATVLEVAQWLGHSEINTTIRHYAEIHSGEPAPWVALRGEVMSFAERLDRVHRLVTGTEEAATRATITIEIPPGMTADQVLESLGGLPEAVLTLGEDGTPSGVLAPRPEDLFWRPVGHVWVTSDSLPDEDEDGEEQETLME